MKKIIPFLLAVIAFASCTKQTSLTPEQTNSTGGAQKVMMNQQQLGKVIGIENAAKHFAQANEVARKKGPSNAVTEVPVWYYTLTLTQDEGGFHFTTTADPKFASFQNLTLMTVPQACNYFFNAGSGPVQLTCSSATGSGIIRGWHTVYGRDDVYLTNESVVP